MKSLGSLVNDAIFARLATTIPGIGVYYRGEQSASPEYVLFLDSDERYDPDWSDKDGRSNTYSLLLQFWSADPRTNANRAKVVIDDLYANDLEVTGFTFYRMVLEQNQEHGELKAEGQSNQFMRLVRLRFMYQGQ